jgi:hypothetical protein
VRKSLVTGSAFGPFFPLGKIHLEAEKYILSRKTIGFYYGVGGGGTAKNNAKSMEKPRANGKSRERVLCIIIHHCVMIITLSSDNAVSVAFVTSRQTISIEIIRARTRA